MSNLALVSNPPDHFNFAIDVVDRWARERPELLAMYWISDEHPVPLKLTYAYFSAESQRAAKMLVELGAKPGDRLMIILNRCPAW